MNIIAVDDEKLALDKLVDSIEKSVAEARVHGFRNPEQARDFVRENSCEIAFLDIKSAPGDGTVAIIQIPKGGATDEYHSS